MPRRRNSSRPALTKKQATEVRRLANQQALRISETINLTFLQENVQLYHNRSIYQGTLIGTNQGVKDDNSNTNQDVRKGDKIILKNLNLRFYLSNKYDRPNVMYKGYLFWYNSGVALTDAVVFFTQQNKMLDRINVENVSLIDSFIVRSAQSYDVTQREHSYLATLNKSWKNKVITYQENSSVPKKRDLGYVIVCYDAYGTLQSDNIASYAMNMKMSFKDP